jgi:hypothetical protein
VSITNTTIENTSHAHRPNYAPENVFNFSGESFVLIKFKYNGMDNIPFIASWLRDFVKLTNIKSICRHRGNMVPYRLLDLHD